MKSFYTENHHNYSCLHISARASSFQIFLQISKSKWGNKSWYVQATTIITILGSRQLPTGGLD